MSRVNVVLPLIFLYPSLVLAEPIYLDCKVSRDKEQKKFSVKLDELSGKITHTRENGSAFNADGFFAANSITYQKIDVLSEIKVTFRYEIDRTDLKAAEVFVAEPADPKYAAQIPAETITMTGSCKLVNVSGRKI